MPINDSQKGPALVGHRNSNSIVSRSSMNIPSLNASNNGVSLSDPCTAVDSKGSSTNPPSMTSSLGGPLLGLAGRSAASNQSSNVMRNAQLPSMSGSGSPSGVKVLGPLNIGAVHTNTMLSREGSSHVLLRSGSSSPHGSHGPQSSRPLLRELNSSSPISSRGRVPLPLDLGSSSLASRMGVPHTNINSVSSLSRRANDTTAPPSPQRGLGVGGGLGGTGPLQRILSGVALNRCEMGSPTSSTSTANALTNSLGHSTGNSGVYGQMDSTTAALGSSRTQHYNNTINSHNPVYGGVAALGPRSNLPSSCIYAEERQGSPFAPSPPRFGHSSPTNRWRIGSSNNLSQQARSHAMQRSPPQGSRLSSPHKDSSANGSSSFPESSIGIHPSPGKEPLSIDGDAVNAPVALRIVGALDVGPLTETSRERLARASLSGSKMFGGASVSTLISPASTAMPASASNSPPHKRVGSALSTSGRGGAGGGSTAEAKSPYCLGGGSRRSSSAMIGPLLRHYTAAALALSCPSGGEAEESLRGGEDNVYPPKRDDGVADIAEGAAEDLMSARRAPSHSMTEGTVSRTTSGGYTARTDLSPRAGGIEGESTTVDSIYTNSHSPLSISNSPPVKRSMVPKHLVHRTNTTTSQSSKGGGFMASSIEGGMVLYQTSMDDLMALGNIMAHGYKIGAFGRANGASTGRVGSESADADGRSSTVSASTEARTPPHGSADSPGITNHPKYVLPPAQQSGITGPVSARRGVAADRDRVVIWAEQADQVAETGRSRTSSTMSGAATAQSSFSAGNHPQNNNMNNNGAGSCCVSMVTTPSLSHADGVRKRSTSEMEVSAMGAVNRTISGESMIGMADPRRLVRNDVPKSIITKNAERLVDDADMESINNYVFNEKIFSTRLSTVYTAFDTQGPGVYAIKVIQRGAFASGWESVAGSAAVSRVNSRATPAHNTPQAEPLYANASRRPMPDRLPSMADLDTLMAKQTRSIANTPADSSIEAMEPRGIPIGGPVMVNRTVSTNTNNVASFGSGSLLNGDINQKPTFLGADLIHIDPVLEKRCREVAIMKEANSVYFVRLHEAILDPKHRFMYLVMEYVTGGRILKPSVDEAYQYERLPGDKAVRYAKQLITALCFLHVKGIVHRDIKPENILLDGVTDRIKITDFGVSETVKSGSKVYPVAVAGTPMFLAPEAYMHEPFDAMPLDVWAFGVTVFALATGNLPFRGGDIDEVKDRIINDVPQYPDDMHPALRTMCKRCLVKDPKKRITMGQLWYACLPEKDRSEVVLPESNRAFYEIRGAIKKQPVTSRGSLTAENLMALSKDGVKRRTHRSGSKRHVSRPAQIIAVTETSEKKVVISPPVSGAQVEVAQEVGSGSHSLAKDPSGDAPERADTSAGFHNVILRVDGGGSGENIRDDLLSSGPHTDADSLASPTLRTPTTPEHPPLVVRPAGRLSVTQAPDAPEVSRQGGAGHFLLSGSDLELAVPLALRCETPGGTAQEADDTQKDALALSNNEFEVSSNPGSYMEDNASFNFTSTADIAAMLAEYGGDVLTNGSFGCASVLELLKHNEPKVEVTDEDLENAFVIAQPSMTPRRTPDSRVQRTSTGPSGMGTPSVSRVPSGFPVKQIDTTQTTPRTRTSSNPPMHGADMGCDPRLDQTAGPSSNFVAAISLTIASGGAGGVLAHGAGTRAPYGQPSSSFIPEALMDYEYQPTPTASHFAMSKSPLVTPRHENPIATMPPSTLASPETLPSALNALLKRRVPGGGAVATLGGGSGLIPLSDTLEGATGKGSAAGSGENSPTAPSPKRQLTLEGDFVSAK